MDKEYQFNFRVLAKNCDREFARWTEALNHAKSLIPSCKSLLEDIRIFVGDELIWVYSRSHKYPMYIGEGTYNRLAKLFIAETIEDESK